MPLRLFSSKKRSTPKGSTLKKPQPMNSPAGDFPCIDEHESVVDRKKADLYHAMLMKDATLGAIDNPMLNDFTTPASSFPIDPIGPVLSRKASKVLLGRQDSESRYFTRRYASMPNLNDPHDLSPTLPSLSQKSERPESTMLLSEYDPYAFELYKIWLHTGTIPTHHRDTSFSPSEQDRKYTWQTSWPLINAIILGHTLSEPDFTDRIMDLLISKVMKNVCADPDTIDHLFSQGSEDIPVALQQFVVDRCIDSGFDNFRDLNIRALPSSFIDLALETALKRLSYAGQVSLVPECEYHTHETLEGCYKRKLTPAEIRRMRFLEVQRDTSRRESGEVVKLSENDEIERVDWAGRLREHGNNAKKQKEKKGDVGVRAAGEIVVTNGDEVMGGGIGEAPARSPLRNLCSMEHMNNLVGERKSEHPSPAEPPPPSGTVELQGDTAHVMHHEPLILAGHGDLVTQVHGLSQLTQTPSDLDSRHESTSMHQSGVKGSKMGCGFEERITCPGAFPDSRAGSPRRASRSDKR
ncbi:hypothetical protein N0V83_005784 [Neocucurbitaria cava]|uniref:Uncharacterized protein n=1 Tax=Neocucurbitaria cava TaxID=798079 RepID=A0A9W8Y7S6_9PLEO|nr:hypothetical protein N0V83_005784 [Neocucurbitaria cava]